MRRRADRDRSAPIGAATEAELGRDCESATASDGVRVPCRADCRVRVRVDLQDGLCRSRRGGNLLASAHDHKIIICHKFSGKITVFFRKFPEKFRSGTIRKISTLPTMVDISTLTCSINR